MQQLTFVIATGGTAGHVVPSLAIADELRASGHTVHFIGADRAEAELVPAAGYELHPLRVTGLSRSNPIEALKGVGRAGKATVAASRLLKQIAPDAVLGGGGYVAGPVGAAAIRRRIPLVLTEADSHLGLTNRLLAPFATRVCLAFALAGRSGGRYLVTGRPVPAPETDRSGARATFGIPEDALCVLVFGGSLGARSINEAAVDGLAGADFHVLHASGVRDYEALKAKLGEPAPAGYDLRPYISPFAPALAAADLAVARSGGSVFELAAHGLPAILIPYPHAAADHQTGNARWMKDGGAAVVVTDGDLDASRLRSEVDALLSDRSRLAQMAAAAEALARPNAAADIAAEVVKAAEGR